MRTVIVGGGAAGTFAAIIAAKSGDKVVLLEKNEKIGKKLYITGKGRCNLTNSAPFDAFIANVARNPKFLFAALKRFDSEALRAFFEGEGLKLKEERGGRVFPQSDKSSDVIKTLSRLLAEGGVDVRLNERVTELKRSGDIISAVVTDKGVYEADKVILATGGLSYSATGSTGDGYTFAKKLGHTVVDLRPALCAITLKNPPDISGLSLKNVEVSVVNADGRKLFSEFGEMLFTESGVSGPCVLTLSSKINRTDVSALKLSIDLKPALSSEVLDARILRDFEAAKNKDFKNALYELLPSSLIPVVVERAGLDKKVNSVTKKEREALVNLLKNLTFDIASLEGIERGVVTSGGIEVTEINPKNMQSKLIKNLYFAGEIIDTDALTGGFNLQIAFSTAYAAAHTEAMP